MFKWKILTYEQRLWAEARPRGHLEKSISGRGRRRKGSCGGGGAGISMWLQREKSA